MNIQSVSRLVFFLWLALLLSSIGCDSKSTTAPEKVDESGALTDADTRGDYSGSEGRFSDAAAIGGGGSGGSGSGGSQIPPDQLTAGEWQDLDNWDFWLTLFDQEPEWPTHQSQWGLQTYERYQVRVLYRGVPASDVAVLLKDDSETTVYSARTDIGGIAELFANVTAPDEKPLSVVVETDRGTTTEENVSPTHDTPITISIDRYQPPANTLDLMFVIDATGSMGDEMEYLKVELDDVIRKVEAADHQLSIRLSGNYYRDTEDDYVVRSFPFSTNISQVLDQLANQTADGGGDYPEAVEQALDDAINNHEWSSSARARLLFHVLDAPPHDDPQIIGQMQDVVKKAAEMGIKIIPVASSGVDKSTEFLLRTMDILTGGTYVFLTDDSGIGGEHLQPTVGDYEVEFLNDLLSRIISRYSVDDFGS